jgi:penicillin-binding protein 1B
VQTLGISRGSARASFFADVAPPDPDDKTQTSESRSAEQRKALKWPFIAVGAVLIALDIGAATAYYRLTKRVDQELRSGPFQNTLSYFAAPETVSLGDSMSATDMAAALKRAGRNFTAKDSAVVVQSPAPVEIQFGGGAVSSIVDLTNGTRVTQYELPPQLITNMSEGGRAKRIPVRYADMPPMLIHAVVSAEDKRFFEHPGIDPFRMAKALYVDLRERRKEQGASTITMQLARNLWLSRDKSWKRKIVEALITLHLEQVLTKQQILEDYCNTVFLGGHGTFGINGFGEAARAYFNKDLHKLTLSDAATLAGLIQRPSYFNPFHYPERALERRNVVLMLMRENKYINESEYEQAMAEPLGLRPGTSDLSETQYFLDLASDETSKKLEETYPDGSGNVDTTLDLRLQRAAEQAIADGMQLVDKELAARHKRGVRPQVALIALDPHTGEVKALCGGRDYAVSQFDRVLSKRPPGSAFKPFVYTAALNTAVVGGDKVFTPASTVEDSPTTFEYDRQTYSPSNFKHEFRGTVTLREALAHSLNVATVKVGQMVGFDNVVALAHSAGMNEDIKPTPAVALGAYQVTPFEIARAYTIFANDGMRVQPTFVSDIRDQRGALLYKHSVKPKRVLDPRVAFLMVDMLQEVLRSGTAAGVRARGFKLPAAGKTGTSHDGWFAGFTSQLLCVVWVGFDDYTELGLEGARSALPIWTEFMMQAARYKQYGDVKAFEPPQGVVKVAIDPESGNLAGPYCPEGVVSYFINGTQPGSECAPQEVEVIPTSDGGVMERSTPVRVPPLNSPAPERSISIEVPIDPPTPAQAPPP